MNVNLHESKFYGILDTAYVKFSDWKNKCQDLINGGSDIIQLRAKRESHSEKKELLQEILPLFKNILTPLIINDDIELAMKYPNLGLHIGQDDTPANEARKILGSDRILGLSTHSIDQVKDALEFKDILSYFCIGPIFSTQTKPDYIPVGLDSIQQINNIIEEMKGKENYSTPPLFCIGGINRKNIKQVKDAGAKRVVVVSDVLCDNDTEKTVRKFKLFF